MRSSEWGTTHQRKIALWHPSRGNPTTEGIDYMESLGQIYNHALKP